MRCSDQPGERERKKEKERDGESVSGCMEAVTNHNSASTESIREHLRQATVFVIVCCLCVSVG